jgi:hypothetical protein
MPATLHVRAAAFAAAATSPAQLANAATLRTSSIVPATYARRMAQPPIGVCPCLLWLDLARVRFKYFFHFYLFFVPGVRKK